MDHNLRNWKDDSFFSNILFTYFESIPFTFINYPFIFYVSTKLNKFVSYFLGVSLKYFSNFQLNNSKKQFQDILNLRLFNQNLQKFLVKVVNFEENFG